MRSIRLGGLRSRARFPKVSATRQEKEISALCDEYIQRIDEVLTNVLRDLDN